jgi:hypothetical protein
MLRPAYLLTLVSLQVAFAMLAVPPLTRILSVQVSATGTHGAVAAILQLASCSLAALGLAVVLNFPAIALLRHLRRGAARFRGIPHWAVAVALTGAAILLAVIAVNAARPLLPVDARALAGLVERPALMAAIALMAAGALSAELLRRSVAPPGMWMATAMPRPAPAAAAPLRFSLPRIEVTHPLDLRTRLT